MSFRYIVVCDQPNCSRQQGILTPDAVIEKVHGRHNLRNDGGGVYPEELPGLGWKEDEEGRHTCPFCANPCPDCAGTGQADHGVIDTERPPGTFIHCPGCGGMGIARAKKDKGEN